MDRAVSMMIGRSRRPALGPQYPADVQAVDLRHHHVEHQQVGAAAARLVDGGPAVVHHDGQMALALEVAPDQLGLLRVVLGDEDPGWHDLTMTAGDEISMKIS